MSRLISEQKCYSNSWRVRRTYVSTVDINSKLANLNLCKANRLATEPVTLKDFVCKAIESESIVKCVEDEMLGEQTYSTATHSAAVGHRTV